MKRQKGMAIYGCLSHDRLLRCPQVAQISFKKRAAKCPTKRPTRISLRTQRFDLIDDLFVLGRFGLY